MPISPPGSNVRDRGFTPLRRSAEHGFTSLRRSAEHGFTSLRRSAEHGFTLVELMVTITIIALMASVAVWALPDPRGRVTDEALRFAARTRAARDEAVVEGRAVSVWVTTGGYGFDQRLAGSWTPIADKPLRVERWGEGTRASLDATEGRIRVTFDPTGLPDRAADVRLDRSGRAMLIRLGADGSVRADAQ